MAQRVKLKALGCRLNEAELEEWARRFQDQGFRVVGDTEPADLIVINTCAVTQEAVRKSRQLLRRGRRDDPEARLVISGCLATLEAEALSAESGVALVVGNRDKDRLVEIALDTLALPAQPSLVTLDDAAHLFARGRQRTFIKVQDGCRYQCTFCLTTHLRGAERSRPPETVVAAINRLAESGIQEVVLTGVHLGGYGQDLGSDLVALLRRVLAETEIPRIRLGSLEPWGLTESFWRCFEDPRLMPHLHLPLQSGSDAVLRRMARRCKSTDFVRLVEQGRAAAPGLNISTDIIVGFPGETDDDWRQTLDAVEQARFSQVHRFDYSPRAGTLAARMPDPVDPMTRRQRGQALQTLAARLRHEVMRAQIGQRTQVLCEGPADSQGCTERFGYTPNYLPVHIATEVRGNPILEVQLTGLDPEREVLSARPVPSPREPD